MATDNDIRETVKELSKVIGLIFYVTTNIPRLSPEYYPLWVAVHHGMNLIDQLNDHLKSGGAEDGNLH